MTDDRVALLGDVAATLWPAPHEVSVERAARGRPTLGEEFLLLPSRSRPRLLAPVGRRAAAAAVRQHGQGGPARVRLAASALALGLRVGLAPLVARDRLLVRTPASASAGESLPAYLGEVLGCDLTVGMAITPPRANRKPVLQLLDPDGRTLAYAKLAVDDLTDALVRTEAAALDELAGADTRVVHVPGVLHLGTWRGRSLLVQSALPVESGRRPLTAARLVEAVGEVAAIGRRDGVPLARSAFRQELTARLHRLPPGGAAARLAEVVRRLDGGTGDVRLSVGAAHGDWTPWNTAAVADRLLVWDWERFRHGIPVGFDLLHHGLQTDLVPRGGDPATSARRMIAEAAGRLRPLGVPARAALVTALLYGVDLAVRYLTDRQQEAGARLGDVGAWLVPALSDGVSLLEGEYA
ncbi:hypothetical protein ACU610_24045 [Geodermatophilus sp. URMC 61]|uniref:hypothetical protein n=1 Tax=Geodermatophilus sp. URMC 61 TaxID=3423411 RepID=UPI00406CE5E7